MNYFLRGIHTGATGDSMLTSISFSHNFLTNFLSFLFDFFDNNAFMSLSSMFLISNNILIHRPRSR